jgi:hypothetical protein
MCATGQPYPKSKVLRHQPRAAAKMEVLRLANPFLQCIPRLPAGLNGTPRHGANNVDHNSWLDLSLNVPAKTRHLG